MISVIIPTYNTELLISRTIQSILTQSFKGDYEIIIIDDYSTDNTIKIIEAFQDSRIRLYKQSKNVGPAAARNLGLKKAQGEYLVYLDGDDYWENDYLQESVNFLDSHPEAVAVSVMQKHKLINNSCYIRPDIPEDYKTEVIDDFYKYWAKYHHCMTGSIMLRTQIAKLIGGMREDIRINEDWEFWSVLATYGKWGMIHRILFVSDGGIVTRKQGWLNKNMKRWQSAPSVEEWSKRTLANLPIELRDSFKFAQGFVARNISYSNIMCNKNLDALTNVQKYGAFFPHDKISSLYILCSKSKILWCLLCSLLRYREINRKMN